MGNQHSEHDCTHHAHCCPQSPVDTGLALNRRTFLGGVAALGGMAATWASLAQVAGASDELPMPTTRRPLVVKPILTYSAPQRRTQTSWRNWGGIQTDQDAQAEVARIQGELNKI